MKIGKTLVVIFVLNILAGFAFVGFVLWVIYKILQHFGIV